MAYGGAAAAHAAVVQAVKTSGVIVRLEPSEFVLIASKARNPLIVASKAGWRGNKFSYLTSYKGLAFYAQSSQPLDLPGDAEIVNAKQIWVPS
ncbi:hypothetical protein [Dehalogenimonas etheniformans]|uniref:Uncharacterized protein n=1 Tax=Dehalogenimonas etheniformans TaxID=1536648 RepID=A0A2P5P8L6_9CHLR|nr:hypothetical protein [Dehalogenimonas etheniformans]PPD58637.1 hypothetical protein JP09_001810 [Dehalogenimonas etheniformans]QNT76593.1 hypothetical protein HX448_07810 [Dehalogenimonas etheniformans]